MHPMAKPGFDCGPSNHPGSRPWPKTKSEKNPPRGGPKIPRGPSGKQSTPTRSAGQASIPILEGAPADSVASRCNKEWPKCCCAGGPAWMVISFVCFEFDSQPPGGRHIWIAQSCGPTQSMPKVPGPQADIVSRR